jgi:hypothetical protein
MKYEVALFELAIEKKSMFNYFIVNIGYNLTYTQKEKRKTTLVIGMKVLSVS